MASRVRLSSIGGGAQRVASHQHDSSDDEEVAARNSSSRSTSIRSSFSDKITSPTPIATVSKENAPNDISTAASSNNDSRPIGSGLSECLSPLLTAAKRRRTLLGAPMRVISPVPVKKSTTVAAASDEVAAVSIETSRASFFLKQLAESTAHALADPKRLSHTSSGRSSLAEDDTLKHISCTSTNSSANRPFDLHDFDLSKPLGKGKFGNVYLAKQKVSGAQCAFKVLFKSSINNANASAYVRREVEIQSRLKHENIIQMFGYFHDVKNVYMILEFAANGELFKHVQKHYGGSVSEELCKGYVMDAASALVYMHDRHVMHRDVKPENMLITADGRLKIADFGWACHHPPSSSSSGGAAGSLLRTTMCGTPEYIAPEMLSGMGHNHKVDVWAMGVFMYELLTGRTPFVGERKRNSSDPASAEQAARFRTYENIKSFSNRLHFDACGAAVSEEAKAMIGQLVRTDMGERVELRDLLREHKSWFAK